MRFSLQLGFLAAFLSFTIDLLGNEFSFNSYIFDLKDLRNPKDI